MGSMPPLAAAALQQAFGLIDRQVLGAPAATISFAGLDTANKMFRFTGYLLGDAGDANSLLRLNADAAANYDEQRLFGDGAATAAARSVGSTSIALIGPRPNQHDQFEALIAKQQTGDEAMMVISHKRSDGASLLVAAYGGIWNNVLALVSRIDLVKSVGNYAAGTVAILEGNQTT